jgi:hypothetical protein
MNNRFYLEKLVVTGVGAKEASLKFTRGVNLIIGSSDTGKSYVYQCIDYLLGSATCPKDIPESNGYTEAYLQIKTNDNRVFTIYRNLKTPSKASVSETVFEKYKTSQKIILGEKNGTFDGENLSEFLLKLMGVKDVLLKTNAQNKTRKLSFRDIARLTLIDETRIITEGSPVYTSMTNYYDLTVEKSAFRYLLTENFDNELIEKEEKKVFESRIKGKIELIASLVLSKNKIIEDVQKALPNLTSEEINKRVSSLLTKLETSTKRIGELTTKREIFFNDLQKSKSSMLQSNEILKRFYLLRDHYSNDLNRLNFILEGDFLFKQLITKDCPVCGTKMDEEHLQCLAKNKENKVIGESVKIEGKKIELKLKDLTATIKSTETSSKLNNLEIEKLDKELKSINSELNSELIPLQQNFQSQITQLINYNKSEQEILSAKNDITKLYLEKEILEKELQSKPKLEEAKVDLEYTVLKTFSEYVEKFLIAWKFPGLTSVEFNNNHKIFDLTISGRGRNSHGKGVRAVSYSAFTFGLLDYCIEKSKPHSGFILLDSPLTTYHNNQKREKGDEINSDMQESFFRNLTSIKNDRQIIILDNKVPPTDIIGKINYIQFSNDNNSIRKGFFPK